LYHEIISLRCVSNSSIDYFLARLRSNNANKDYMNKQKLIKALSNSVWALRCQRNAQPHSIVFTPLDHEISNRSVLLSRLKSKAKYNQFTEEQLIEEAKKFNFI